MSEREQRTPDLQLCDAGDGILYFVGTCKRCRGRGYHHGFGERGLDPDWCLDCGGSGQTSTFAVTPWET